VTGTAVFVSIDQNRIKSMTEKKTKTRLKAHMMQAMVESALTGHDIGDWPRAGDI
jgi:hypothetical protein